MTAWRRVLFAAVALSLVLPLRSAGAWEHNIVQWSAEKFPLPLSLRPESARDTDNETLAAIIETAIEEWNRVACSSAEMAFAGVDDLPIAVDDQQVLAWESDPDVWVYGSASAGATIIDVLGEDGPRVDIRFNDVNFDWIVGANTFVTPDYEFGVDPNLELDPASVITHEVGHLIGLAHPNPVVEGSQPDGLATMVFALLPNAQQSTLAADDKLGLCAKYPAADDNLDECDGDTDCRDGEICRDATLDGLGTFRVCDESRGTFGDFCGIDAYVCGGICLFATADFEEGLCTEFCETDDDCPQEPVLWTCQSLPTTTGDNVDACLPDDGEGGRDAGAGAVDTGFPRPIDEEPLDATEPADEAGNTDTGSDAAETGADAPPSDTAPGGGGGGGGGGKGGCATAPVGTSGPAATLWLLALVLTQRRRRHGHGGSR